MRRVKVAIIGAGTAGLSARREVERVTDDYVVIDDGPLGTTCARVGCMPSKVAIQVAEDFHRRHIFERYGVGGAERLDLDVSEAMEHIRDLRDSFVDRVLSGSTDNMGEEFIQGYAEFLEPNLLKVGDTRVRAGRTIIATGSRPYVPDEWLAFSDRILTTDQLFEQDDLPDSVAVLGLGIIGVEIGQSLQVSDLNLDSKFKLLVDEESIVAGVSGPKAEEEEEVEEGEEEGAAEPEVITEKKEEEGEE